MCYCIHFWGTPWESGAPIIYLGGRLVFFWLVSVAASSTALFWGMGELESMCSVRSPLPLTITSTVRENEAQLNKRTVLGNSDWRNTPPPPWQERKQWKEKIHNVCNDGRKKGTRHLFQIEHICSTVLHWLKKKRHGKTKSVFIAANQLKKKLLHFKTSFLCFTPVRVKLKML